MAEPGDRERQRHADPEIPRRGRALHRAAAGQMDPGGNEPAHRARDRARPAVHPDQRHDSRRAGRSCNLCSEAGDRLNL